MNPFAYPEQKKAGIKWNYYLPEQEDAEKASFFLKGFLVAKF